MVTEQEFAVESSHLDILAPNHINRWERVGGRNVRPVTSEGGTARQWPSGARRETREAARFWEARSDTAGCGCAFVAVSHGWWE
jgi:hypothetical protein